MVIYGHNGLDYGEGYVMLSRCTDLNQIFLDPSFDLDKHLKVHPQSLVEAMNLEERCIAAKQKKDKFDIFTQTCDPRVILWMFNMIRWLDNLV